MRFRAAALLAALALVPACAKHLKITMPNERPDISSPLPSPLQLPTYPVGGGGGKLTYTVRTGAGVTCAKMYGVIRTQDVAVDGDGGILCGRGLPFHKIRICQSTQCLFSLYPFLTPSPSSTPLCHHNCHHLHCCVAAAVAVRRRRRTVVVFRCRLPPGLQPSSTAGRHARSGGGDGSVVIASRRMLRGQLSKVQHLSEAMLVAIASFAFAGAAVLAIVQRRHWQEWGRWRLATLTTIDSNRGRP